MSEANSSHLDFMPEFPDTLYFELPQTVNENWCEFFNQYFGMGDYKTCLESDIYMLERVVIDSELGRRKFGSLNKTQDDDGQVVARNFIGTFAGFELRADPRQKEYTPILFANLTDVRDDIHPGTITGPNDVGLLIPVEKPFIELWRY